LAGGDLNENLTSMVKTWQVFRGELGTVDIAQGKMFKTMEEGCLSMKDLAVLLPDILPAAKAFGVTFDEVAGSLITATQVGGRSEKTFTGIRNIITRLSAAQKEGIELTGTFAEKMEQLSSVDPDTLKRIFG